MLTKAGPWILALAWAGLFLARPAQADGSHLSYIDPGTGSFVLQTLLGILFGLAYALKIYWRHVMGYLRNTFSRKPPDQKSEK